MFESVDELTVTYEEDGRVVVEELEKAILTRGAWATVLFKYREWDRRNECMGPVKFTIRRYQRRDGVYRQQAKFNISSVEQARLICSHLERWLDALPAEENTP